MSKLKLSFIGLSAVVVIYTIGFLQGWMSGINKAKIETLNAFVAAQQIREKIDDEIRTLDPVDICIALGGLREECIDRLRGLDAPTGNQVPGTVGER